MKTHENQTPSPIVQRFKFNLRVQAVGENISSFVTELRNIAEHCQFENTLEDMLRDRLVCGTNDERLQRILLSEPTLTFKKAYEKAQAFETASQNAMDLKRAQPSSSGFSPRFNPPGLHQLPQAQSQGHPACFRCGRTGHNPRDCRFKDAVCRYCDKKGHIEAACRKKARSRRDGDHQTPKHKVSSTRGKQARPSKSRTNVLKTEPELVASTYQADYAMFHIHDSDTKFINTMKPMIITMNVDNHDIDMEIDTGAALSVISKSEYENCPKQNRPKLEPSGEILRTYTGEKISVVGCLHVKVECNSRVKTLPLYVLPGKGPTLLGRNWLLSVQIDWSKLAVNKMSTESVTTKFKDVFVEELGTLKGVKAEIRVTEDAKPKFFKARIRPKTQSGRGIATPARYRYH